jgi:hypothetical protein
VNAYSWDADFCKSEINLAFIIPEYWIQEGYTRITLRELLAESKETLFSYGFATWSAETPNLLLIPLWLVPFMDPFMTVICIDGEEAILSKVDLDERVGCIAYGINHE